MDVYNKLTFINRISDQSEGINEWMFITSLHSLTESISGCLSLHSLTEYRINQRESVYNKLTFINRISDQSEGINEWMFITSLHSLTEYRINQRESMTGCL